MSVKLNSTGGGSVTLDSPSTASNYTVTLPTVAGTLATTTGAGSVFTNPTINGFTGDTSAITIGTTQFVKDSSGNIGIGTSSPGAKLDVSAGSAAFAYSAASRFSITNNSAYATTTYSGVNTLYLSNASTTAGTGSGISFGSAGSGTGSVCTIAGIATNNSGYGSALVFQTRDTSGNDAERMRLDSSGNLLLGTTTSTGLLLEMTSTTQQTCGITVVRSSPNVYTDIYGCGTGGTWLGSIRFFTSSNAAASERARIQQDGAFGILCSSNTDALYVSSGAAAGTSRALILGRYGASAMYGGTQSFIVWTNGNVQNTNNSYGAISDIKLKENVVDATPKLDDLMRVRVVNYNFIEDTKKQIGVIAQELEQVFPGMVDETPDRDEEGNDLGTTTKSVKYSVFTPILVKAIQELAAQNQTLEARLATLEAK
jgi:hypothetical protein